MHLRAPTIADAAGIARVHVESSEDAYAPLAAAWEPHDVDERARMWESWLSAARSDPHRFYEARGGEIVTNEPTTFQGGSVTERVYLWPAGRSHSGH